MNPSGARRVIHWGDAMRRFPGVDYHVHSNLSLCAHPSMGVEVIEERAAARGFSAVAVTDHVDVPADAARVHRLRGIVDGMRRRRVDVLVGCEIGWNGDTPPVDLDEVDGADVILLSPNHFHTFPPEMLPDDSVEECADALLQTFDRALAVPWGDVLAHPLILFENRMNIGEVLRFIGEERLVWYMRRFASRCIALEMSPRLLRVNDVDAVAGFFRLAVRERCKVSFGSDAHRPSAVCALEGVFDLAGRAGVDSGDVFVVERERRIDRRAWLADIR